MILIFFSFISEDLVPIYALIIILCCFKVNLQGTHVRRKNPIGESPKDVDNRTVYVVIECALISHYFHFFVVCMISVYTLLNLLCFRSCCQSQ